MVEFIMGQGAYLLSHEWPAYVFDGTLMLLVMVGFYIFVPARLDAKKHDQRDSLTELTVRASNSA
jgi:hypothetical protein